MLDKNIFLLWLQGWDNVPWLVKQVAESWKINNPDWKIHYIDSVNLRNYITDIDYIYDSKKKISCQALSDIIRLSLLKNHGGVWADATLLCMQPLDKWVHEAVKSSGFWMYHGHGGGMNKENGPASWFIVSEKNNYIINKWKMECDYYWTFCNTAHNYFWMDILFRKLFENELEFNKMWSNVPYLYCELDGESHSLAKYGMENNTPHIKNMFNEKPPYVLKFSRRWDDIFPDKNTEKCINSNGYYAIQMSKRIMD